MGQLINRLKNYFKSEINFQDSPSLPNDIEFDSLNKEFENLKHQQEFHKMNDNQTYEDSFVNNIDYKNAYLILEIDENSTIEEIKMAYRNKVKEYHPDKVQNMGTDIRQLAEKKTLQINQAYEILKKHRNFN